ncbi:MAG: hypothetical protein ACFBSC_10535 [Microcoleaceae cyanobacterium]
MPPSLLIRQPVPLRNVRIPLQVILIVPFLAQIIAFVGLTGYLTYRNGERGIYDLGNKLIAELSERVDERLDSYLGNALLIARINADAFQIGQLSLTDLPTVQRRFLLQMRQIESFDGVYLGTTQGQFLGVFRTDSDELQPAASRAFQQQLAKQTANEAAPMNIFGSQYDPRERPW